MNLAVVIFSVLFGMVASGQLRVRAAERASPAVDLHLGAVIPQSVQVAGLDDVPISRAFGLIVVDGKTVVVIERGSRRVVQVYGEPKTIDALSRPEGQSTR